MSVYVAPVTSVSEAVLVVVEVSLSPSMPRKTLYLVTDCGTGGDAAASPSTTTCTDE